MASPRVLLEAAVIVATPVATPRTNPEVSTTATAVSLDNHEKAASGTTCPFASLASAASRTVSPAKTVSAAGETPTDATCWATVTDALPDAEPAAAAIMAAPLPVAVTSPDASTVATDALSDRQATATPAINSPCWSSTSADSCTVAPRAVNSAALGLTMIAVGCGGSGEVGSVPPSPQA